ncbi:MAG: DNA-formamidopyrimidine glycosylase family protein [Acidimicrobiales bacterium]
MPELIEVEMYRRALGPVVGAEITHVDVDPAYLRPKGVGAGAAAELVGLQVRSTARVGKLLLVDVGDRTVGLRFGMTGRILVGGVAPIEKLEYSSGRDDTSWDRLTLSTTAGKVVIRDPRRLGSLDLDPDVGALGPDAGEIAAAELAAVLHGRTANLKSLLLNQKAIAGLGNLLVDETLWRAALSPHREAGTLPPSDIDQLQQAIVDTVALLTLRGGSHMGDTFAERHVEGVCPLDGEPMTGERLGGRGTWWCTRHQR